MDNPLKDFAHSTTYATRFCLKCRKRRISLVVEIEAAGFRITLKRCLAGHETCVVRKP